MLRLLIIGIIIYLPVSIYAIDNAIYASPDGKLKAYIISVGKKNYGTGESRIEILNIKNDILVSKSYESEDGEHGLGVEHSQWTPDSEYFIFSTSSSGGHQAWHYPTYFYVRKENRIRLLDDYIGSINIPNFRVSKPDIIITRVMERDGLEDIEIIQKLSDLLKENDKLQGR